MCLHVLSCKRESSRRFFSGRTTNKKKAKERRKKNRQDGGDPSNCYLLLIVSKPSRTESKGIKRRERQSGVDVDFTCWDVNLSITDVTQQLPDVGLRSDGRGGREGGERERERQMGVCTGSFSRSARRRVLCVDTAVKQSMRHHRFVSSEFLRGESCGRVEVGMMISETASRFFLTSK